MGVVVVVVERDVKNPSRVNGAVFQMMAESRRWEECRGLKRFC